MEQSPPWEANRFAASQKIPQIYGTRKFITAFTSVRHLSLSWASSIQSIPPHPTSWRSTLTLSSHLRLGLLSGFFHSGFPTKTLYTPLHSPIRATWPANLIFLDFITCTIVGEQYRSLRSSNPIIRIGKYNHVYLFIFIYFYNSNQRMNTIVLKSRWN
jgi:hypothetical protein